MPIKPPSLRPSVKRKPWAGTKRSPRLRGRAGVRDRERIRAEEPLCRICDREGRVAATEVIDHIVPLFEGGTDERSNKQGLCRACHDAKTAEEAARAQGRGKPVVHGSDADGWPIDPSHPWNARRIDG